MTMEELCDLVYAWVRVWGHDAEHMPVDQVRNLPVPQLPPYIRVVRYGGRRQIQCEICEACVSVADSNTNLAFCSSHRAGVCADMTSADTNSRPQKSRATDSGWRRRRALPEGVHEDPETGNINVRLFLIMQDKDQQDQHHLWAAPPVENAPERAIPMLHYIATYYQEQLRAKWVPTIQAFKLLGLTYGPGCHFAIRKGSGASISTLPELLRQFDVPLQKLFYWVAWAQSAGEAATIANSDFQALGRKVHGDQWNERAYVLFCTERAMTTEHHYDDYALDAHCRLLSLYNACRSIHFELHIDYVVQETENRLQTAVDLECNNR